MPPKKARNEMKRKVVEVDPFQLSPRSKQRSKSSKSKPRVRSKPKRQYKDKIPVIKNESTDSLSQALNNTKSKQHQPQRRSRSKPKQERLQPHLKFESGQPQMESDNNITKEESSTIHFPHSLQMLRREPNSSQFQFFKRPNISLFQMSNLIDKICSKRRIKALDFFLIAPKFVFALFFHNSLKNIPFEEITFFDLINSVTECFRHSDLDPMSTFSPKDIPSKHALMYLVKKSIVEILKIRQEYWRVMLKFVDNQEKSLLLYSTMYLDYYQESIPEVLSKRPQNEPKMDQQPHMVKFVVEEMVNQLIFNYIDMDCQQYMTLLNKTFDSQPNQKLTQALCIYSVQNQSDRYLLKIIQNYIMCIHKSPTHIASQRYLLSILLILLHLPSKHLYLNSKQHKKIIPMIVSKLLKIGLADKDLAKPLLVLTKELYELGDMRVSPTIFYLFVDGLLYLENLILEQKSDPLNKANYTKGEEYLLRLITESHRYLLLSYEHFSTEVYLCDLEQSLKKELSKKFRLNSNILYETNQDNLKHLVDLLESQIMVESGNMFKILIILKKLKMCQGIEKCQKLVKIFRRLINYIKKNQMMDQIVEKANRPNQVMLKVLGQIHSLMLIFEILQCHTPLKSLHTDNHIVDDIRFNLRIKKSLMEPDECLKWVEEYVLCNHIQFNLCTINNVLLKQGEVKRKLQGEKEKILTFADVVDEIDFGQQYSEQQKLFLQLFHIVCRSYAVMYCIPFFFAWMMARFRLAQVADILNILYKDIVGENMLPQIQGHACILALETFQILILQKDTKNKERDASRIRNVIKQLDKIQISRIFYHFGYPKQALFYIEKGYKWNAERKISSEYLTKSYYLHKQIENDMIVIDLDRVKTKYRVEGQYQDKAKTRIPLEVEESKILQKIVTICQRLTKVPASQESKSSRKSSSKSRSRSSSRRKSASRIKNDQSTGTQEHTISYQQDIYSSFNSCYSSFLARVFELKTVEQQQRQSSLIMISQLIWCYSVAIKVETSHRQNLSCGNNLLEILYFEKEESVFEMIRIVLANLLERISCVEHRITLLKYLHDHRPAGFSKRRGFGSLEVFVTNTLIDTYLKEKRIEDVAKLLTDSDINSLCNQTKLYFQKHDSAKIVMIFDLIQPSKDKAAKHKHVGPEDIITLDYCLMTLTKGIFVHNLSEKALIFLQRIVLNETFWDVRDNVLDHFCNVLSIFFLQFDYSEKSLSYLLETIEKWIDFCHKQNEHRNCDVIGAFYLRFYFKRFEKREQKEREKLARKPSPTNEMVSYKGCLEESDKMYQVIKAYPQYFKDGHKACFPLIEQGRTSKNRKLKLVLVQIAKIDIDKSIWWIIMLKNYKFIVAASQLDCDESSLWEGRDHQNVEIGASIFEELQKHFNKRVIQFIKALYALFYSHKKNNQAKIKFSSPVTIPFKKPLTITGFSEQESGGRSKCMTKFLKVYFEENILTTIILKAEFKASNNQNQSKFVQMLEDFIPDQLGITYKIIQLSKYLIMVEYLEEYKPLKAFKKQLQSKQNAEELEKPMKNYQGVYGHDDFMRLYHTLTPVLPSFFQESSAYKWWKKVKFYSKTTAIWSIICKILGLGDRHADNIMMNQRDGRVAHIDFQCSFDNGKCLGYPQYVFFRFTPNIQAPLGILGSYGPFTRYMLDEIGCIQKHSHCIAHQLLSFNIGFTRKSFADVHKEIFMRAGVQRLDNQKKVIEMIESICESSRCPELLERMYMGWDPVF